jgi:hypothetical protein
MPGESESESSEDNPDAVTQALLPPTPKPAAVKTAVVIPPPPPPTSASNLLYTVWDVLYKRQFKLLRLNCSTNRELNLKNLLAEAKADTVVFPKSKKQKAALLKTRKETYCVKRIPAMKNSTWIRICNACIVVKPGIVFEFQVTAW